uniref:Cytochrome P450 n=1 Tax=Timema monikensis TaxID=170555 RepID=A0A7R9HI58_9NEOP|nr:unnamed protein product [Timema monikensis]
MGLLFESLWADLVVATATVVLMICWKLMTLYSYWSSKGVPNPKPKFFYGNTKEFMLKQTTQAENYQKLYNDLEGHPFGGVYQGIHPFLILRDPEIIRLFMSKDFNHFTDRGFAADEKRAPLSGHLFNLGGQRWKSLRVKLTPTFTSGKIKMMFNILAECAERMKQSLENTAAKGHTVEIKEVSSQYTTEVIGSCAFGLQIDSINNPESEFRKLGRGILNPSFFGLLRLFIRNFFPSFGKLFIFIRDTKLENFFLKVVKDTVKHREENNIERKDFLQLLIEMKHKDRADYDKLPRPQEGNLPNGETNLSPIDIELTDNLLASQCFVFFVAGFETSSATMSFCLHELAVNQDVQSRLTLEVDRVLKEHGGNITYEAIQKMKYMDQVVDETLRKYPPLGNLDRTCTKAYTIPGTKVHLEKGTNVKIPVYALHYDPKYYPDPHKFDPERFNEENKTQRHTYTYLPFGEGPKNCIGMRFGLMQVKVGLVSLLSRYQFSVCPQTKIPLVLDPTPDLFVLAKDGVFLRINDRKITSD